MMRMAERALGGTFFWMKFSSSLDEDFIRCCAVLVFVILYSDLSFWVLFFRSFYKVGFTVLVLWFNTKFGW